MPALPSERYASDDYESEEGEGEDFHIGRLRADFTWILGSCYFLLGFIFRGVL